MYTSLAYDLLHWLMRTRPSYWPWTSLDELAMAKSPHASCERIGPPCLALLGYVDEMTRYGWRRTKGQGGVTGIQVRTLAYCVRFVPHRDTRRKTSEGLEVTN